jgi:phage terminase small subunit
MLLRKCIFERAVKKLLTMQSLEESDQSQLELFCPAQAWYLRRKGAGENLQSHLTNVAAPAGQIGQTATD